MFQNIVVLLGIEIP